MRYLGAIAGTVCALSASGAVASQALPQQVQLDVRIAEVSGDFRAGLGFDWRSVDGSYRSTANEPPGSGSGSLFNGLGTVGGTIWFNTGTLSPAPGNPNALNLGFGVEGSGYFGGDDEVLELARRNSNTPNIFVNQSIDYTIDLLARASIPILAAPRITGGGDIVLFIEPFIGASVIGAETEIMSDRTGIGGNVLVKENSEVLIGGVAGVGLTTEIGKIPFLGDIPVLGGLFYKARRVPGSSASVTANNVTETGSTDAAWQHEALIVIITPFIVRDDSE